jgi:hypothetical protein
LEWFFRKNGAMAIGAKFGGAQVEFEIAKANEVGGFAWILHPRGREIVQSLARHLDCSETNPKLLKNRYFRHGTKRSRECHADVIDRWDQHIHTDSPRALADS